MNFKMIWSAFIVLALQGCGTILFNGNVVRENNEPVTDYKVSFYNSSLKKSFTGFVDSDGRFSISADASGVHKHGYIVVLKEGFEKSTTYVGSPSNHITIVLKEAPTAVNAETTSEIE